MQDIESVEKKLAQLIENAIKTTRSFTNSNYSPRGAMVMNLRKKQKEISNFQNLSFDAT